MPINYLAVLACGILSMVIGFLWYGPLWGKQWMEITGANLKSKEECEEMKNEAGPLYVLQFLLTLFQVYVLAYLFVSWDHANYTKLALFLWAGFVLTTVAGSSMWNGDSPRLAWSRFLIQAGYQLIMFILYASILSIWA